MTDAEQLARVLEIIEDEQRLEAYAEAKGEQTPQRVTEMRAVAFRQIANFLLHPRKARW
jgi:hypothetical protein